MGTEQREPFLCVECSLPLPIKIEHTEDAASIECAGCGAKYRGHLWTCVPEARKGNARIIPSSPGSQSSGA